MNYKIVGFSTVTGSALVKFFTDEFPEGMTYSIDIPVENGAYISGEALANHIMAFAPFGQIARIVALRDNPPSIAGLNIEPPVVPDPPVVPVDPVPKKVSRFQARA
ncbi:hypothetical protein JZU71_03735, partial [bacterium]|nr:hypothetical protein [bacterium]